MKKLSLYKKLSIYFTYRSILMRNKKDFLSNNLRIDRAKRIYTVLNIPPESFDEPYNLRTTDINRMSEPFISEYIKNVSSYLNSRGLSELYKLYDIQKVDKYSYLVIIGFALFDTNKVAKNIFYKIVPSVLLILVLYFLFQHFVK